MTKSTKFSILVGTLLHLHTASEKKGEDCSQLEKALSAAILIHDEALPALIGKDMKAMSDVFLGDDGDEDVLTH